MCDGVVTLLLNMSFLLLTLKDFHQPHLLSFYMDEQFISFNETNIGESIVLATFNAEQLKYEEIRTEYGDKIDEIMNQKDGVMTEE